MLLVQNGGCVSWTTDMWLQALEPKHQSGQQDPVTITSEQSSFAVKDRRAAERERSLGTETEVEVVSE